MFRYPIMLIASIIIGVALAGFAFGDTTTEPNTGGRSYFPIWVGYNKAPGTGFVCGTGEPCPADGTTTTWTETDALGTTHHSFHYHPAP